MTQPRLHEFVAAFHALPLGVFFGETQCSVEGSDATKTRRYHVRRQSWAGGRSHKLIAEELGGGDYISLNLYHLPKGPALRPCEMPIEKVLHFVLTLRVLRGPASPVIQGDQRP